MSSSKRIRGPNPPSKIKQPKASNDAIESDYQYPKWKFNRFDWGGPFCLSNHDVNTITEILKKLGCFETMTWQSIKQQTHDSAKSSSHFIGYDALTREGKKRFSELKLGDYEDMFFSLRLKNTERVFGILSGNSLEIVWYDHSHKVAATAR